MLNVTNDPPNLSIKWAEPAQPNGNISYVVTVLCQDRLSGGTNLNTTLVVQSREAVVARSPFSGCIVTVIPQTGAGRGPSSNQSLLVPEEGEMSASKHSYL